MWHTIEYHASVGIMRVRKATEQHQQSTVGKQDKGFGAAKHEHTNLVIREEKLTAKINAVIFKL